MADWLLDIEKTQATGIPQFRLPYPGGTWIEEKNNNELLIHLMRHAYRVARIGWKTKNDKKLTDDESKFLDEIVADI